MRTGVVIPWSLQVQDGDLGTWDKPRILLVLEDVLARPAYTKGRFRHPITPKDPDEWEWGITSVKCIMRYSWNSVPVEVITFVSQEICDLAADWFNRYDIEVASTTYYGFTNFTRSLVWRRNSIQEIIDTDPERLLRYGQLGRQILWDSEF